MARALAAALPVAEPDSARCAPSGAALGKNANRCGTPDRAATNQRRRDRWEAQRALWDLSTLDRVSKCRRVPRSTAGVSLELRPDGDAQVGGLVSCGSVWSCPRCASRIWAGRGDELRRALDTWHERGGTVALVTLTMRHRKGQGLAMLWDALGDAWAAAASRNRKVRRLRDELGVAGWVRVVEATNGRAGWHLHTHALVFLDMPPEQAQTAVEQLGAAMFDGWSRRLVRAGLDAPLADKGGLDARVLDLREAREHAARYPVKATYERAAYELTGATGKDGRRGNRSHWGILRGFVETGDCADLALWHEWERASKGRRALTWSAGLRNRVGLDVEHTDEELAEDEQRPADCVALISKEAWAGVCALPGGPPQLLEAVERARDPVRGWAVVCALLAEWGLDPPRPPPS